MSPLKKSPYRLLLLLLAAGGLSALCYLTFLANKSSAVVSYKPETVHHEQHGNMAVCDHLMPTSHALSMMVSNETRSSFGSDFFHAMLPASTPDFNIYNAFRSSNITTPQEAEKSSPKQRLKLESQLGISFPTAARAFTLYHSYLKSFNRCDYRLLKDPGPCEGSLVTTLIVVTSLPSALTRRMSIRRQLVNFRLAGFRLVFISGRTDTSLESQLEKEATVFGDIIWADFSEDYNNLTIKTIIMLRWAEKSCLSARYIVKADDDVYLNMARLEALLTSSNNLTRTIIGQIRFPVPPTVNMDSKWYMPSYMFNKPNFPPYANGPCYTITTDLLYDINRVTFSLPYFHLEDIFVAVCLSFLSDVKHTNVPDYIVTSCGNTRAVACHGCSCSE